MRAFDRWRGLPLHSRKMLLLLLLFAVFMFCCRCEDYGKRPRTSREASVPQASGAEVGLDTAVEEQNGGKGDSISSADTIPIAMIDGLEETEAKGTSGATSYTSGYSTSSKPVAGRALVKSAWAGLVAFVMIFVIMAERKLAVVRHHAQEVEKQAAVTEANVKAIIESNDKEEAFVQNAAEQIKELEDAVQEMQLTIQELEKRKEEVIANVQRSQLTAEEVRDRSLEQARKRLDTAIEKRTQMQLLLNVEETLHGMTEEAAKPFLEELEKEAISVKIQNAKVLASMRSLSHSTNLDQALDSFKKQLSELKGSVKRCHREIASIEEETAAKERELEEDSRRLKTEIFDLTCEVDLLEAELQLAREKAGQEIGAMNEQMHAVVKEIEAVLTEQDLLKRSSLIHGLREQMLEKALEDMQGNALVIDSIFNQPDRKKQSELSIPSTESLYPQEARLLQARRELKLLKSERSLMQAMLETTSAKEEKEQLANALKEVMRVQASLEDADLEKGDGEILNDETPEALKKAKEAAVEAQYRLDEKLAKIKAIEEAVESLQEKEIVAAKSVKLWKRVVASLSDRLSSRALNPQAYASATFDLLIAKIENRSSLVEAVRQRLRNFAPVRILKAGGLHPYSIWQQQAKPDDYLVGVKDLLFEANRIRLADSETRRALWRWNLVEDLQEVPLSLLVQAVAEGPEGDMQKGLSRIREDDLNKQASAIKELIDKATAHIQELRTALETITRTSYWSEDLPRFMTLSLAFIVREEEALVFLKERKARLEETTPEQIQSEVRQCFIEALYEAKRRREIYGEDQAILKTVHDAHRDALDDTEVQMDEVLSSISRKETDYCPFMYPEYIPQIVEILAPETQEATKSSEGSEVSSNQEADQTENGITRLSDGYTGRTVPNVLQLRRE